MHAKKSLGQNFLIDPNYRRKIVAALSPRPQDSILEIGPGKGVLSDEIANQCDRLWMVEKDRHLASLLSQHFADNARAEVISGDFLTIPLSFLGPPEGRVRVIGNLPYNRASQIFLRMIENRHYFDEFFLMFQKEVAARFMAQPKTRDYGLLTLWGGLYTECKILFHLPPTAFRPRPKVTSSLVHFKIKLSPLLKDDEAPFFWSLMRRLFQHRRKTIRQVLRKWQIDEALPSRTRAEELDVESLIRLASVLHQCFRNLL